MELAKEKTHISKWGNSKGFRVPKELMKLSGFSDDEELTISVEVTDTGKKRLVIEEPLSVEEKLEMLDSLEGILSHADKSITWKQIREERRKERMAKYGISD